jgi:hypothetical protein
MTINLSTLTDGSNIAEWVVIIDSWSNGLLMGGLLLILALIIFSISKASGTEEVKAFMGTAFVMFLISTVGWFVRVGTLQLVQTFMPMFFLFMTGIAIVLAVVGDRVFSNS